MADRPVREYLVSDTTALFGPDCSIRFCTGAPADSVVTFHVDGRTVRALLTRDHLHRGCFSAALLPAR